MYVGSVHTLGICRGPVARLLPLHFSLAFDFLLRWLWPQEKFLAATTSASSSRRKVATVPGQVNAGKS